MIHSTKLLGLALLLLFAASCKDEEKPANTTKQQTSAQQQSKKTYDKPDSSKTLLATVNGESIYKEDLGSKSLDTAIDYAVLYQIGLQTGVDKMFEENIENYKRKLVLTQMITKIMAGVPDTEVTDKQITTYYNKNVTKYSYLDVIEFSTDDQTLADETRDRAAEGERLRDLAAEYKKANKPFNIRDYRNRTNMQKIFDKPEEGMISKVIEKNKRYKIYKIVRAEVVPLKKVYYKIKKDILRKRRADVVPKQVQKLVEEYGIDIEIIDVKEDKNG